MCRSYMRLHHGRVITYAIEEKECDKAHLNEKLINPDKQDRLEVWVYDPKQFSEDANADDISVALKDNT